MKIDIEERVLHFKQPAGTSRGVYTERKSWFVHLSDGDRTGIGECAPLPDLSCDALPDETYEAKLHQFCQALCETGELDDDALRPYPSMRFGLETALLSLLTSHFFFVFLHHEQTFTYFNNGHTLRLTHLRSPDLYHRGAAGNH